MSASFVSLVWNTMEWNWVGENSESNRYLTRLKLIPLYSLASAYKCISTSVIIAYFRWYSILPIGTLALSLNAVHWWIRKKQENMPETSAPSNGAYAESIQKYNCKDTFCSIYIVHYTLFVFWNFNL